MALVTRGSFCAAPLLRGLLCVLAGAGLACGDTLVDGRYSGTARFIVGGSVNGTSQYVDSEHPTVRVGVFWSVKKPGGGDDVLVEQPGTSVSAEYYRRFELKLFDEPGPEHLNTPPSGASYAIGWLAAYQDTNANERKDEDEPLIGGSNGRLLLRAPQALSARESPTGGPVPEGWHIVSTPLTCSPVSTEPVPTGDCGVPLGASCKVDADCGGGVCVHDFIGPWPTGSCLIQEPPPNGCRQKGSVLLRAPDNATKAYWLKGCAVTADCGRAAPYQCDQQIRGCRPSRDFQVDMNDRGPPRGFCKPPGTQPPPPP
jgi:hypothetical protein